MWADFILPVLNVGFFIAQMFTPGIGKIKAESDANFTILTPADDAFKIWMIIYLLQAIFLIYSFLPVGRKSETVQKGVSVWFILATVFSSAWIVLFTAKYIAAAFAMITLAWLSLAILLWNVRRCRWKATTPVSSYLRADFWTVEFPFSLHFGWMTAALILSLNILFQKFWPVDDVMQFAMAIASIVMIVNAGFVFNYVLVIPIPTASISLVWLLAWQSATLDSPNLDITPGWATAFITATLAETTGMLAALVATLTVYGYGRLFFLSLSGHPEAFLRGTSPSISTVELLESQGSPV